MNRTWGILLSGLLGLTLLAPVSAASETQSSALAAAGPKIEDPIIIKSFDEQPIVATLMLPQGASASNKVPAVLETHGWGGRRARTPGRAEQRLLNEGYAVLTWDSRGFGDSGGEANVGSPQFEVKDAQALIDYLATRPEIKLDGPKDPRVGWVGGSNAAGVQFNTAAKDDRVDAIVPFISWGNLTQDLSPNGVYKKGWGELLYNFGLVGAKNDGLDSPAGPQTGDYAEQIHDGHAQVNSTGEYSKDIHRWFRHKSTDLRSGRITAPTLIVQGSVDTLFPLEDAFRNYRNLKRSGTPVRLMTYCSGHTLGCTYPGGDSGYPKADEVDETVWEKRVSAWLAKYLKGKDVNTGPEVEWQAPDGYYYKAPRWPLPGTRRRVMKHVATGPLVSDPGATGGDGATDGNPAPQGEIGSTAARITIKKISRTARRRPLLGVPVVKLTGRVTGPSEAYVFLELVDIDRDGRMVTVDDQTMPVKLQPGAVKKRVKLHGVSWLLRPGHKLALEVSTASKQYDEARSTYVVDLKAVTKLPIAKARWVKSSRRTR